MAPQQHRELDFNDYLGIAKRRAGWIIVPAVVVTMIAIVAAYVLPATYNSVSLILIEKQQVPGEYVKSVVAEDLNARLSRITEQLFSRSRLVPIIEHFNLYSNESSAVDEKLEELRKNIVVTPIKSVVSGANEGSPGFTITVILNQPRLAQQVCAEIAAMFLSENLKSREESAEGTTQFLEKQLADAKRDLDEQDAKLAAFQTQYVGQLPGQDQANFTLISALNTQLQASTQALARLEQDKAYTEAILSQQTTELEAAQAGNSAGSPQQLQLQVQQLQAQLTDLQARYTPDYPDIIKVRRQIESLKKRIESPSAAAKQPIIETPQVQQLHAQLQSTNQGIVAQKAEQDRIQQQIKLYQSRIQLSPMVQEKNHQLTRDYETAQRFYTDLLTKKDQSAMASDLERRQQGEQFKMVDAPNLPDKPSFPNRLLFAFGGLAGGLVLGGGLAALAEYRDKSLRDEKDVLFLAQMETLAMIPVVASATPRARRKLLRRRKTKPQLAKASTSERK